jgi:hypothetical protein
VADAKAEVMPGRWQRRVLRAVMPAGILLLLVWVVWVGLPFVMGTQRTDISVGSAVIGLVTSLILIATGRHYRRMMPVAQSRDGATYSAGQPHPFVDVRDSGLAAMAAGSGFRGGQSSEAAAAATTNRYQRMNGCAVPGCGKQRSADIHAPAET